MCPFSRNIDGRMSEKNAMQLIYMSLQENIAEESRLPLQKETEF